MRKKQFFKILSVSFLAIMIRGMFQLIIPQEKSYFKPSIFVASGVALLALIIYGTVLYMVLSYVFLLVEKEISGSPIFRGLKYGGMFALMWIAYLYEPLPNNSIMDMIYYPIIDGSVIVILGALLGKFIAKKEVYIKESSKRISVLNIIIIALIFSVGRIVEYKVFNVFSQLDKRLGATLIWVIAVGIVIGFIFEGLRKTARSKGKIMNCIMFGGVIFGVNLFFFNFFIVVIAKVDIVDLLLRTILDIVWVIIGAYVSSCLSEYLDKVYFKE